MTRYQRLYPASPRLQAQHRVRDLVGNLPQCLRDGGDLDEAVAAVLEAVTTWRGTVVDDTGTDPETDAARLWCERRLPSAGRGSWSAVWVRAEVLRHCPASEVGTVAARLLEHVGEWRRTVS